MLRRLAVIFVLAAGLASLLILRPWEGNQDPPPRFFDRLPDADIVGKSNIHELSRALSSTMYYYKIPIREFLSHEFILGQGKNFGLDLQKPVFFFADQKDWELEDFGILTIVADSSKIPIGLEKLYQLIDLKDTLILGQKVYKEKSSDYYFTYGKDWLLTYHGKKIKNRLATILTAKRNEIPPKWREFLNSTEYSDMNAVAYMSCEDLDELGIESTTVTLTNDSTSIYLNAKITQKDTLRLSLKESGPSYNKQEFTKHLINLHLNTEQFRFSDDAPLFKLTEKYTKRINFPIEDLISTWTGDVAFRQGGIQEIEEKYVESVLDENFNVTEIVKVKKVKIPSFSLHLSVNENGQNLVDKLYKKGILTHNNGEHRLLYSPPMNMKLTDSTLAFYTGKYIPALEIDSTSNILWTESKTAYSFRIDSTNTHSVFTTVQIPLQQIVKENIPDDN
jgi:hypothetical protein